jgi:hypothetical protein
VDSQRHDEDPHPRDLLPKLILAGRLTGTLDGLPVSIDASDTGILASLGGLGCLVPLLRSASQVRPLLGQLAAAGIPLTVRLAGLTLPVLPRPHWLVRLFFKA